MTDRAGDFGAVIDLAETAIVTSYVYSAETVAPYRARIAQVQLVCTLDAGSSVTALTVKMEGSLDGVTWAPLQSRNQATDGSPATKQVHGGLAVAAGATTTHLLTADPGGLRYLRVGVQADVAGGSGDSLKAHLTLG